MGRESIERRFFVIFLSLITIFCLTLRICADSFSDDIYEVLSEPIVSAAPEEADIEPYPVDEEPFEVEFEENDIYEEEELKLEEPEYWLSDEEIELIALVVMGEAEGEPELGQRLVIDTILNRVDDPHFPDSVTEVVYQANQFSVMWNGRIDRCYVKDELVELVKDELTERTNDECVFFMAGGYSQYGEPMFQECCHYFSSYAA